MVCPPRPTESVEKVIIDCGRRCALCVVLDHDDGRKAGLVVQIDQSNSSTLYDNLIFLCFEHESEYHAKALEIGGNALLEYRRRTLQKYSPDYDQLRKWLASNSVELDLLLRLDETVAERYLISDKMAIERLLQSVYSLESQKVFGDLHTSIIELRLGVEHLARLMDDCSYRYDGVEALFDSIVLKISFLVQKREEMRGLLSGIKFVVQRLRALSNI